MALTQANANRIGGAADEIEQQESTGTIASFRQVTSAAMQETSVGHGLRTAVAASRQFTGQLRFLASN